MFNNSHNPYFSRWFSAILREVFKVLLSIVTILILVDGFLQYSNITSDDACFNVTILILVDGFLQ